MELLLLHKADFAVLIVRIVAGILFLFQAYDKIFRIGLKETANASQQALHALNMPRAMVRFVVGITAFAEFAGGLFLIAGFMIIPSLFVLAACMLPVTLAMSLREPMWNMQHVWARLVMIVFLLMVPMRMHFISIDHFFGIYAN